jgi:hypothetical protein
MSSKPDYKVEYAKSNRSECKGCRNVIGADSIRIGKMVQSRFFDGKIPMWYHNRCFFQRWVVPSADVFAGIDQLRWEDQQKLHTKVQEANGTAPAKEENKLETNANSATADNTTEQKNSKGKEEAPARNSRTRKRKREESADVNQSTIEQPPLKRRSTRQSKQETTEPTTSSSTSSTSKSNRAKKGQQTPKVPEEQESATDESISTYDALVRDETKEWWRIKDLLEKNCTPSEMNNLLELNLPESCLPISQKAKVIELYAQIQIQFCRIHEY